MSKPNWVTLAIVAFVVGAIAIYLVRPSTQQGGIGPALATVTVPALSSEAKAGEKVYGKFCATCHGKNAAGQDGVAPPLVHKIYEPGHHADVSFRRAAKFGVRAHHWRFGNMPAIEGITQEQVSKVIVYVRELQRANGIN